VTRPPVLAGAREPLDDLDWLTAVDATITARSPLQPGPCPSPTAQQARPWPDRPQAESHDELLTELVHLADHRPRPTSAWPASHELIADIDTDTVTTTHTTDLHKYDHLTDRHNAKNDRLTSKNNDSLST
jgi:hypothetical protein